MILAVSGERAACEERTSLFRENNIFRGEIISINRGTGQPRVISGHSRIDGGSIVEKIFGRNLSVNR